MKEIELNKKKPSKDLINLIENSGQLCRDFRNSVAKIKQRGHEEGFSDFEIVLLAREVLRPLLTRRQLNYWFPIRRGWKNMLEESSGLGLQTVQNDDKNDLGQSSIPMAAQTNMGDVALLNTNNDSEENDSIESKPISKPTIELNSEKMRPRLASYFDLVDPRSIDCSNHPMFQKVCEKMERLKLTFYNKNDKTANISSAEDDLENQNQSFSLCAPQKKPQDTNYFYVSKDSNFGKEHFKAEIEVVDAIEYLRQFVGKFQRIDLGFRVVE